MAKKKAIRGKHADQSLVNVEEIARAIRVVRGHRVLIDANLASFYGVTTKALNQAVKRNADRFPADFAFQLSGEEFADLRSQSVTSSSGHGGRRSLPLVFTEHGVAMLSSVLNSPAAVRVNIEAILYLPNDRSLNSLPKAAPHVARFTARSSVAATLTPKGVEHSPSRSEIKVEE